ncbi:MAG: molecular chaperone DnaK, partial [Gallionella sp.]|nr:molecular chaperone DnaK [Gallionella sp.]
VKGDDKDAIEAKAEALATAAQKLGEKMYAAEQANAAGADAGASHAEAKKDDGDVVDAEFTEVKDKK